MLVPFDSDLRDLTVGRVVLSLQDMPGIITRVDAEARYPVIDFLWQNGKTSEEVFICAGGADEKAIMTFLDQYFTLAEMERVSDVLHMRRRANGNPSGIRIDSTAWLSFAKILNEKMILHEDSKKFCFVENRMGHEQFVYVFVIDKGKMSLDEMQKLSDSLYQHRADYVSFNRFEAALSGKKCQITFIEKTIPTDPDVKDIQTIQGKCGNY